MPSGPLLILFNIYLTIVSFLAQLEQFVRLYSRGHSFYLFTIKLDHNDWTSANMGHVELKTWLKSQIKGKNCIHCR